MSGVNVTGVCKTRITVPVMSVKKATVTLNGVRTTFCSSRLVFDTEGQSLEAIELKQCEGVPMDDLLVQFGMCVPHQLHKLKS
jgi:hypothetical protein